MKKHYKLIVGLIIGFMIGSIITGIALNDMNDKNIIPKENTEVDKSNNTNKKDDEENDQNMQVNVSDTWDKNTAYVGGNTVIYQGKEYRAKWWTQNEMPNANSEVWEYIGEVNMNVPEIDEEEIIDHPSADVEDFKVVAYYPSWKPQEVDKIDYSVITHINYAFAIPTSDGGLRDLDNADVAKKIIEKAHQHNVKVMLAIGGWSYNDTPLEATFMSATETDEKIQKFGDAIVKMCNQYGFDGIDMDWEHPRVDGTSKLQYEKLMVYLKSELSKFDKLLSAAVLSGVTPDGNVYYDSAAHTNTSLNAVDWINVMAYDGGDGSRHSSYEFAVNSAKYWHETRKLPSYKVVLGVPFYARPSWASYDEILKQDESAHQKDISTFNGMEAHYNGMPTIEKKARYAKENLGGVMIWEITQDTRIKEKRLIEAIKKGIK